MLAALGLIALEVRAGRLRWLWRAAWLAALIVSIAATCGASCQFMDMYAYSKPAAYQALARWANRLAVQVGWSPLEATQAVELTLVFPTNTTLGRQEALVASGTEASLSLVLAEYIDADQMRFIFFISGQNWGTSPLRLDRTAPHTLRIELGGMLPPATHPFWKDTPPSEITRRRLRLSFSVDGQTLSTELGPQPEPVDANPRIGAISGHATDRYVFTGKIVSQRIVRIAAP
jgi:hypothetical protein